MMLFFTGTGLERVGAAGLNWNGSVAGSGCCASLQKQVAEGVSRGFTRSRSDA